MTPAQRIGRLVAALLVVGAALFVVGVVLERSDHHDQPAAAVPAASGESAGHDESAERGGETTTSPSEAGTEKVLGLDVESAGLVAVGVVASVALAALVWLRPRRHVFVVIAVFAAAFVVLDVAEVVHQLDHSREGLAVLAAIIGLMHAGAVGGATVGGVSGRPDVRPVAAVAAS
jgi:energy-converting hydrogenase Eha subunit A